MSKMEASYHANTAGINASTSARAEGDDKTVNAAILATTVPCGEACGWTMFPLTVGTLMVMDAVMIKFKAWVAKSNREENPDNKYILGALENMACADPHRLQEMLQEDFEQVIYEAERLCYLPFTERHKLMQHQVKSFALLHSLTGGDDETDPQPESSTPGK